MPRSYLEEPFEYKRKPLSYLAGPDIQDYQGRYNNPQTRENLSLLATSRDPSVAPTPTPAAPTSVAPAALQQQTKDPNWWAKLGPGGQSRLLRSALAAGSSMLELTDPEARNPLTAVSRGVLRGLEVSDEIKEAQREEALRGRLADIDVGQSSAEYAAEVAKTYGAAGKPKEAISIYEAASRLAPEVSEPLKPRTVSPGQGVYFPETGETKIPVPATPKPPKEPEPQWAGGRWWKRDKDTGEMKPLTEKEVAIEKPKENIIEIDAGDRTILYNVKTGKEQASFERGARPSTGAKKAQFVRVPTGETDDFGASIEKNMLVVPDETREGGFRILEVPPDLEQYGPPAPTETTGVTKDVQDRFSKSKEAGLGYGLGEIDPATGFYKVIDKEGKHIGYFE